MTSRGAASPTATAHELLHTWATSTNPAGRTRALRVLLPPAAPRRGTAVCQVQGHDEATPCSSAPGASNRSGRWRCLSMRSCQSWSPEAPGGTTAMDEWQELQAALNERGHRGFRVEAVTDGQEGRAVTIERSTGEAERPRQRATSRA